MTPENPEDIITDTQSGTSDEGFFFEFKVMTTEALMNICGSLKIILNERFREEIKPGLKFCMKIFVITKAISWRSNKFWIANRP